MIMSADILELGWHKNKLAYAHRRRILLVPELKK